MMGRLGTVEYIFWSMSGTGLAVLFRQALKQRRLRLVLRPGLIRLRLILRESGGDSRDRCFNRFLELLENLTAGGTAPQVLVELSALFLGQFTGRPNPPLI